MWICYLGGIGALPVEGMLPKLTVSCPAPTDAPYPDYSVLNRPYPCEETTLQQDPHCEPVRRRIRANSIP